MIIIVDSNIVFSAILNTKSTIGDLLLNSQSHFTFYTCHYLEKEISKYWVKLLKASKLSEENLNITQALIFKNIVFRDEQEVPRNLRLNAFELVQNIDVNDLPFVALNNYLDGFLWTGDKKLINGLKQKGYQKIITTMEMVNLRKQLG